MIDISETSNNVRCTYSGYDATLTGCVEVTMTLRSIAELDDWVWVEFSPRADGYYPPSAPNFLSPLIFFILFPLK